MWTVLRIRVFGNVYGFVLYVVIIIMIMVIVEIEVLCYVRKCILYIFFYLPVF